MNLCNAMTNGFQLFFKQFRNTPLDQRRVWYAGLRNLVQYDASMCPPLKNVLLVEGNLLALLMDSYKILNFKFSTLTFSISNFYAKTMATLSLNLWNFLRHNIHPLTSNNYLYYSYSRTIENWSKVGLCLSVPMPEQN